MSLLYPIVFNRPEYKKTDTFVSVFWGTVQSVAVENMSGLDRFARRLRRRILALQSLTDFGFAKIRLF